MEVFNGYKEVIPDQTDIEKWTEISLSTGGSQSTLQEYKVPPKSGGMCYKDQSKYYTRNRFLYWRTSKQVLELVEESLDITLTNNRVRYQFADAPILGDVTICEVPGAVLVLVATVSSVHRLSFPHPDVIHKMGPSFPKSGVEYTAHSILAEANVNSAKHPTSFYVLNNSYNNSSPPLASASAVAANFHDCVFALSYADGKILLAALNDVRGASVTELDPHADALMPRFLSRALRGKTGEDAVPVSLLLCSVDDEMYLLTLCKDGNVRAWSIERQQCRVVTDFPPNMALKAQGHSLKVATGSHGELFVGVFHCFTHHSTITILRHETEAGNLFKLTNHQAINIANGPDLVDFAITGNLEIWTVQVTSSNATSVHIHRGSEHSECVLDKRWELEDIVIDADLEPKQAYLNHLFYPGRFPAAIINKALSIYRKANIITDVGVPTQVLKERVSTVVDAEIYGGMREREYTAEEVLQLQNTAWQRFYSCVMEYYLVGARPLGLIVMSNPVASSETSMLYKSSHSEPSMMQSDSDDEIENGEVVTSGIVLIKNKYISLIRPMDTIENVTFSAYLDVQADAEVSADLVLLISVLDYLEDNWPEDAKLAFDKSLKQLKTPVVTVSEFFAKELSVDGDDSMSCLDLLNNIVINLEKVGDLSQTISEMLDLLDVGQPDLDDTQVDKSRWLINLGHLYGSHLGISFVANSLHQMVDLRFKLCRSLLMLVQMLQSHSFRSYTTERNARKFHISPDIVDRTSHLIQCYFLLRWISETPIHSLQFMGTVENSVSILKLNQARNPLIVPESNKVSSNITILHLFLESSASTSVRLLLSRQETPLHLLPLWRHSFISFIQVLTQLLWPNCNNTIFPELLLLAGQHLHVQEYTRLLSKWCHFNSFTRKFLLACSMLDTGEHDKAFDLFEMASHGVLVDDFIRRRVAKSVDEPERAVICYYSQVIRLFEQHGLHHLVVDLVNKAISVSKGGEPQLPTLHSVAFLHQLKLGRDQEAFDALLANPDAERRKDCLQQLVVTLVDAKKLDVLIAFNYDGVREELERIVSSRARSLEVGDNPYYNLAFAYHVSRGSFQMAGNVMYEQALRLSGEVSVEALEKQLNCYTVAYSMLKLVKKEDAWLIKPSSGEEAMDTSELDECYDGARKAVVLELSDLARELAVCRARMRLVNTNPEQTNPLSLSTTNASELVGLLANSGLYEDAIDLANVCGVAKCSVFSSLAGVCVRYDETPDDNAWEWLKENNFGELGDGSAATLSWRLLETLLMKEEEGHASELHKIIAMKLIHLGVFLPYWLVSSYKKRNAAELLRLLLSAGRLEEALELGIEYVEAVLGKGKERFGLDTSLLPHAPPVWLPLNHLDLLLLELDAHSDDDQVYKEGYLRLQELIEQYSSSVTSISHDRLEILQREMQRIRTA